MEYIAMIQSQVRYKPSETIKNNGVPKNGRLQDRYPNIYSLAQKDGNPSVTRCKKPSFRTDLCYVSDPLLISLRVPQTNCTQKVSQASQGGSFEEPIHNNFPDVPVDAFVIENKHL